jgi:hypothetical protein
MTKKATITALFVSAFAICSALVASLSAHAQEWFHGVPGAFSNVPVLPGTSPTSWYTTPENVEHIAYVGTDRRIHELFFQSAKVGSRPWLCKNSYIREM